MANYTYQVALAQTEAGMVNMLSSTSSFFTLTLAAIFPSGQSDKFTLSKLLAVLLSICGIVSIVTLFIFTIIKLHNTCIQGVTLCFVLCKLYVMFGFYKLFIDKKIIS